MGGRVSSFSSGPILVETVFHQNGSSGISATSTQTRSNIPSLAWAPKRGLRAGHHKNLAAWSLGLVSSVRDDNERLAESQRKVALLRVKAPLQSQNIRHVIKAGAMARGPAGGGEGTFGEDGAVQG